jgi:hypothetical protein
MMAMSCEARCYHETGGTLHLMPSATFSPSASKVGCLEMLRDLEVDAGLLPSGVGKFAAFMGLAAAHRRANATGRIDMASIRGNRRTPLSPSASPGVMRRCLLHFAFQIARSVRCLSGYLCLSWLAPVATQPRPGRANLLPFDLQGRVVWDVHRGVAALTR